MTNALDIPSLIAPLCPDIPPPETLISMAFLGFSGISL